MAASFWSPAFQRLITGLIPRAGQWPVPCPLRAAAGPLKSDQRTPRRVTASRSSRHLVAPAGAQGVEGLAWEAQPGIVRRTALVPKRGVPGGHSAAMPAGRDLFAPLPQLSCGPAVSRCAGQRARAWRPTAHTWRDRRGRHRRSSRPGRGRTVRPGCGNRRTAQQRRGQTPRVTGTRQQRGGGSLAVPVWAQELVLRRAAARGMRTCR